MVQRDILRGACVGWLVSLTSVREVPGTIPTGSRFFCAGTHGIGYSWPGLRVKCIQYTVGSVLLGICARSDFDVKQNTFTFTFRNVDHCQFNPYSAR